MESIAKMCEECVHYVSSVCIGKTVAEARKDGKKPCGKYQMYAGEDLDIKDDEQLEAVLEPDIEAKPTQPEPVIVEPEATSEATRQRAGRVAGGAKSLEQRQADFQRILVKRLPKAIAAIASIGHLSNGYAYAWTKAEIDGIRCDLETAVANIVNKF